MRRRRRQFLLADGIINSRGEGLTAFAAAQEAAFSGCPEAARFADHEVEAFWAAALYLDMLEPEHVAKRLQKARIPYPVELAFDEYRLGRYLFRRWGDPAVREAFLARSIEMGMRSWASLGRDPGLASLRPTLNAWGGPALLYFLRLYRQDRLVAPLLESYTPEEEARHRALMQYGRLQLHRFLTEAEPARSPSPWEQRKLAKRIRLREVQVSNMRRSIRKIGQERRALQARLRELARTEHPELRPLADEWNSLRKELQELERQQRAELAALTAQHQEALAEQRRALALEQQTYEEILRQRARWLTAARG